MGIRRRRLEMKRHYAFEMSLCYCFILVGHQVYTPFKPSFAGVYHGI